ncbi:RAB6-interacting golgin [Silurus asotus]|uniref:RAB6-interacting golgin n=1 Tax=Silurus asotus TaxID=30991 RepID=A0AAD5AR31_SILAS|nr:RAB6-interacting golgin [Silurus asotus]
MAAWAGFSEEELRRIQQKGEPNETVMASLGRGRRSAPTNRSRQQLQREKALQMAAKQKATFVDSPLPPEQQLQPAPPPPPTPPASCPTNPDILPKQDIKQAEPDSVTPNPEDPAAVKELDKQEVELREKTRLQHLQWEQRIMEEKNKRTKALLAKTIAEKSKQTQAEVVKLKKVQKELQVLDDAVSTDIGVLRSLIEQASLEYSIAWKRLEKAEAEYVAAKLDLHKKTEFKEQLTEHLCAIIQQNELRKARKLEELMLQLELNTEQEPAQSEADLVEGCGQRENPAHPVPVSKTEVQSDSPVQTDCTNVNAGNAVSVTSEGQKKEMLRATASAEG